jgi:hypothetical protein
MAELMTTRLAELVNALTPLLGKKEATKLLVAYA